MQDTLEVLATALPIHFADKETRDLFSRIEPAMAAQLVRYLYPEFKNSPHGRGAMEKFAASVSFSAGTPGNFVSQILQVYEWLENQNSSAHFEDIIEYVSCAVEGSSLQPGHNLQWYLEQHGFEKATLR